MSDIAGLPADALERAQRLAAVVHGDGDRDDVERIICGLDIDELYAVCVTLAAMVDVNKTIADLLKWATGATGPKRCSGCKEQLPRVSFPSDRSRRDGLNMYCRACQSARARRQHQQRRARRLGLRVVPAPEWLGQVRLPQRQEASG